MLPSAVDGWNAWGTSWSWSAVLIAVTIAVHSAGIVALVHWLETSWRTRVHARLDRSIGVIVVVALMLAMLHTFECFLWAAVYVYVGALTSRPEALLYSVDSMTTRGASGLALAPHWRMMGAAESGDGLLLFGISTAFLFWVMQRQFSVR